MTQPSDEQLLEQARAGDRQALEALLERYQSRIYRFGMKMCRNPSDAEDVLQDTLLAMARGVRQFRGASSLSTWLYTVARSHCLKKHRREPPASESAPAPPADDPPLLSLTDPGKAPDEALAGKEMEAAVEQAITGLEPLYREVLILRDLEGLTAPEVAEVLGISVQAVKSRLHRARLAVRAMVAPRLGIPGDLPAQTGGCPDVLTLYSQHLEDDISADLCAQMEKHLEACPRCRNTCDSLKRSLALCRTSGSTVEVPASVRRAVKIALTNFLAEQA